MLKKSEYGYQSLIFILSGEIMSSRQSDLFGSRERKQNGVSEHSLDQSPEVIRKITLSMRDDKAGSSGEKEPESITACRIAAEQGDVDAQIYLGFVFETGNGIAKNEAKAAEWYRKAAEQGNALAQTYLALMFARGQGVPKNEFEATKWFQKAAQQGNSRAQYNRGARREFRLGEPRVDLEEVGERREEAAKWYLKAAKQGNLEAQINLGLIHAKRIGEKEINKKEVAKWLRIVAEKGCIEVQFKFAQMLEKGEVVIKDVKEAVRWYRTAAEQGHVEAQLALGDILINSKEPSQSDMEGMEWYRRAADQGEVRAQFKLGWMYENGKQVAHDVAESMRWYRMAAQLGYTNAQERLAGMPVSSFSTDNEKFELIKWKMKSILKFDDFNDDSTLTLDKLFYREILTLDENRFKLFLIMREIYGNHKISEKERYVAILKEFDKDKGESEKEKIRNEVIKDARRNSHDIDQQFKLGLMFSNHPHAKLNAEAIKWLLKAAEQGHVKAQYKLGTMLEEGRGGDGRKSEAVIWYRKAAAQGDIQARCKLALLHEDGLGGAKVEAEATRWLQKFEKQRSEKKPLPTQKISPHEKESSSFWTKFGKILHPGKQDKDVKEASAVSSASPQVSTIAVPSPQRATEVKQSKDAEVIKAKSKRGEVRTDSELLISLRKTALEEDDAEANVKLGMMYANGDGVAKDEGEAEQWYKRAVNLYLNAALRGDVGAQYNLGVMLEFGRGATKDIEEAMRWYAKAAKQGNELAKASLERLQSLPRRMPKEKNPDTAAIRGRGVSKDGKQDQDLKKKTELAVPIASSVRKPEPTIERMVEIESEEEPGMVVRVVEPARHSSASQEKVSLTKEQLEFVAALQTSGLTAENLAQIQRNLKIGDVSDTDIKNFKLWAENFSKHLVDFETLLTAMTRQFSNDVQAEREQFYIDKHPKLKIYQQRLQRELSCFIMCYFLAPAGIFSLQQNKKDLAISAIGQIPLAGVFLKILAAGLSFANAKYRFYQINHLSELFTDPEHISRIACSFARKMTIAKESIIEKQVAVEYKGLDKLKGLYQKVKEMLEMQWKDLATSDRTGVKIGPEDKLAVLDCAFLLQQILSGKAKIEKEKDLAVQFVQVVTGESYKVRDLPPIVPPKPVVPPRPSIKPIVTQAAQTAQVVRQGDQSALASPTLSPTRSLSPSQSSSPLDSPASVSEEEFRRIVKIAEEARKAAKEATESASAANARAEALSEELSKVKKQVPSPSAVSGGGNQALALADQEPGSVLGLKDAERQLVEHEGRIVVLSKEFEMFKEQWVHAEVAISQLQDQSGIKRSVAAKKAQQLHQYDQMAMERKKALALPKPVVQRKIGVDALM